jgi:hypothetical protein
VAGLDAFGLPGQRSAAWRFTINPDTTPPFLRIDSPSDGSIIRDPPIKVEGETEPGAAVAVNGISLAIGPNGRYSTAFSGKRGDATVEVVATDAAGNKTKLTRSVRLMPDVSAAVQFDPSIPRDGKGRLLTAGRVISMFGITEPNSRLELLATDGATRSSTETDAQGAFRINADLRSDTETFGVVLISPSGFRTQTEVSVALDNTEPKIGLAEELPRITSAAVVILTGTVAKSNAKLTLNGRPVELANGRFNEVVPLIPGDNPLELTATDTLGHTDIQRLVVTRDAIPPTLVRAKAEPVAGDAGSFLSVDVSAADENGLAATARCAVALAAETVEGVLTFNPQSKSYQGAVAVPRGRAKLAVLKSVDLVDAAGNRKVYRLN